MKLTVKDTISIILWNLFVNKVTASRLIPSKIRTFFYKSAGLDIENLGIISAGCFMGSSNVQIGEKSFVNYNCFFDSFEQISIGKNCLIAMEVMFCTSTHETTEKDGYLKVSNKIKGLPIRVEDDCWIGARSTILPGITIHEGCIVGAGALVTQDCEAHCLYAGVPAKKIKELKTG